MLANERDDVFPQLLMVARERKLVVGRAESQLFPRVQNVFIRQIILKIESTASASKAKLLIQSAINQLHSIHAYKNVPVIIDVDPM